MTKPSLREEIRTILVNTGKLMSYEIDQAIKDIISAIKRAIPKKEHLDKKDAVALHGFKVGVNQAIDDFTKELE